MLKSLSISNYALIDQLSMQPSERLSMITGETGAGKSILVDALGLLLGERSDAAWVRAGAERTDQHRALALDHGGARGRESVPAAEQQSILPMRSTPMLAIAVLPRKSTGAPGASPRTDSPNTST